MTSRHANRIFSFFFFPFLQLFPSRSFNLLFFRLVQLLLFSSFISFQSVSAAVQIKRLGVPSAVLNGTKEPIILDCDFTYDSQEDHYLVVKWFFGTDTIPIYQWIPEINEQTIRPGWDDVLSVHNEPPISLSSSSSSSSSSFRTNARQLNFSSRRIRFNYVNTSMSGLYTCTVNSLVTQDTRSAQMNVYAPPRISFFNYTRRVDRMAAALTRSNQPRPAVHHKYSQVYRQSAKSAAGSPSPYARDSYNHHYQQLPSNSYNSANNNNNNNNNNQSQADAVLTCEITDVFPSPEVVIFRRDSNGTNPFPLSIYYSKVDLTPNSAYHVVVRSAVSDAELRSRFGQASPSIFECRVTISVGGDHIQRTKQLLYQPAAQYEASTRSSSAVSCLTNGRSWHWIYSWSFTMILVQIFLRLDRIRL